MEYEDHTYRNIATGLTIGIGLLVAFFVIFSSPPVTGASFDDLFSTFGMPNPFHVYKIKTSCELAYFLLHGPPTNSLAQKISTPQDFQKNFPDEYYKIKKLATSPEFYQSIYQGSSLYQPASGITPELLNIMWTVIMKEYSIDPDLKDQLPTLENPYQPQVLLSLTQNGTCEEEMKQKYANWDK